MAELCWRKKFDSLEFSSEKSLKGILKYPGRVSDLPMVAHGI